MNMDFSTFSEEQLLALARNPAAHARIDALRMLLEKGSPLLQCHPEIRGEAVTMLQTDPRLLASAGVQIAQRAPDLMQALTTSMMQTLSKLTHAANVERKGQQMMEDQKLEAIRAALVVQEARTQCPQ